MFMTNNKRGDVWLQAGYKQFAIAGPTSIKIDVLAQQVGISKSSFYHHFADMELFIQLLLQYHLIQAAMIAEKERQCNRIAPDLVDVLLAHKQDLLFNRQLRINRQLAPYSECLEKANQIVGTAFIDLWVRELQLKPRITLLLRFFELALENFYLQITPEVLTKEWLSAYFKNLTRLVNDMQIPQ